MSEPANPRRARGAAAKDPGDRLAPDLLGPEPNEVTAAAPTPEQISSAEVKAALARRRAGEAQQQPPVAAAAPTAAAPTEPNEVTAGARSRAAAEDTPAPAADPAQAGAAELPSFVRRHFVADGAQFYYRDKPEKRAFRAEKDSFKAQDVSAPVATALVELAQQRGWSSLKVKGSPEFKALVWAAAQERGLRVEGYEPPAGEKAAAAATGAAPARSQAEASPQAEGRQRPAKAVQERADKDAPAARGADPYRGEVVAYGPAPFRHQADGSPSFRVKLRGEDGRETEHWGVGLEAAMRDSGAKVGDAVALERGARAPVTVADADGATKTAARQAWTATRLDGPAREAPTPPDRADPRAPQSGALSHVLATRIADPGVRAHVSEIAEAHLAALRKGRGAAPTTEAKPAKTAERER